MSNYKIYVGSYTAKGGDKLSVGEGIYTCRFDGRGTAIPLSVNSDCKDPSFLLVEKNMLYAVEETADSTVSAYMIEEDRLKKLVTVLLHQKDTCHIQLTSDGRYVSTANYGSGSLSLVGLSPDGLLGDLMCTAVHQGSSIHPRQIAPRVHSTLNSPDGNYILAADLGTDTVTVYSISASGKLIKHPKMGVQVPAGRGPRHMAFSPDGTRLFVVCEISSTLLVYPYDTHSGIGRLLEEKDLIPHGRDGADKAADIHFSPDGRFLYVSVRGQDSIVRMPYENGNVGGMEFFSAYGKSPRNFCITEDGLYLITANEISGNIAILPRNTETGMLGKCVAEIRIPRAVYVTAILEG